MKKHGWKRVFLASLEETAIVALAARTAGVSRQHAYKARKSDADFAKKWDEALEVSVDMLEAKAHEIAFMGVPHYVFWKGERIGENRQYPVELIKFLLSAHRPEKFRQNVAVEHAGKIKGGGKEKPRKVVFEFRGAGGATPEGLPVEQKVNGE